MNIEMMKTRHSAEVLEKLVKNNPARLLESGDVVLPPARLSFANIAQAGKNMNDPTKEGKFGANLLFIPNTDLSVLKGRRDNVLREAFPNNPSGAGMKNPFRNQADRVSPAEGGQNPQGKSTWGYVPGAPFIAPSSLRRPSLFVPPIVNGAPTGFIGDEAAVAKEFYSGCWCIAVVKAYASKNAANPGVFFGLQSLFKVLDDNSLGGGAAAAIDSKAAFGGAQIDAGVNPSDLF